MAESDTQFKDLEQHDGEAHLTNNTIFNLVWKNTGVLRSGRDSKHLITDVDGIATAGDLMAIMGPSGSGKTTLLNVLAHRKTSFRATISGTITVNGTTVSTEKFQSISSFVEQEDALIGSLTVRETLDFAARLSLPKSVSARERKRRVDELISSFGLQKQAHTLVGTPIRRGISGGQKRRLSIASQLITAPKILFLDEPTSGLDSTASFEVVKYLKTTVKKHKLIVIASIHQPSTATFDQFDKLLLLTSGQTCYNGPISSIRPYFESIGNPMPMYTNPAEFLLEITNADFAPDSESFQSRLDSLFSSWRASTEAKEMGAAISVASTEENGAGSFRLKSRSPFFNVVLALLHRSFVKSYRDVVAYGIRFAMYIGLAIMMGTVWLRLPTTQSSIQPFVNSIFFGSAFMSFMAVAYVPAFLEDRATFIKERANGLYGATAFTIANLLIGTPYLFLISLLFSIIVYFLSNFRPGGSAFFTWVMWLFLDLLAAESLVVLISSLFPNFVLALALTAFANGLWMSVGGFLVSPNILNPFWRYVFHFIDYQAYVFRGMMVNEFGHDRTYSCGPGCQCMYDTALAPQCLIDGKGVLALYGYRLGNEGKWVGILVAIFVGYRVLGWGALGWRK